MKKLIGLAGKKQSGKSSLANFLVDWTHLNSKKLACPFAFGDRLKEFARDILGLPQEALWGTDEDKNQLTKYRFDDLPGYNGLLTGYMTIRQILQYWGTEVFRKFDDQIWVKRTFELIEKTQIFDIAVIHDVRFPGEVQAIKDRGGVVIRLTRKGSSGDTHSSETALDPQNYNWNCFDYILENAQMTKEEQQQTLLDYLLSCHILER